MRVKFYGVRGSIATAGETTRRYGGNTSCVAIEVAGEHLIFDAGTGIRALGSDLMRAAGIGHVHVNLFFSHLHWDHIQGFPFFGPAYAPGNRVDVWHVRPDERTPTVHSVLDEQMRAPTFPVSLDVMAGDLCFHELNLGQIVRVGEARLRHCATDHPNGCVAWRIEHEGRVVVYATDLEHDAENPPAELIELCRDADVLIYDAMYTPEEYAGLAGPSRKGWGHGTFESGAKLAELAGVRELCLFHHDPSHDDGFMDALAARARRRFRATSVAREGMVIELDTPLHSAKPASSHAFQAGASAAL